MTTPTGPLSPYITPELLTAAPTGISWSTIPPGRTVTEPQRYAEQQNICARATAMCDAYCNQVLRATLDTEVLRGPDWRVTISNGSGNGRVILQRSPVLDVASVQVSPANMFPHQWVTVPAGFYEPEYPPIGLYGSTAPAASGEGGQAIIIAPGYVTWANGRNGTIVKIQYYNGWPHCGITATAAAGSSTVQVDDCTGWGLTSAFSGVTGASGTVYDAGQQELVQVTSASAVSGPGTLTLASPLVFTHSPSVIISTLPQSISWAVILLASSVALTRGATATTVQTIPGGGGSTTGAKAPGDVMEQAHALLNPFKRVM